MSFVHETGRLFRWITLLPTWDDPLRAWATILRGGRTILRAKETLLRAGKDILRPWEVVLPTGFTIISQQNHHSSSQLGEKPLWPGNSCRSTPPAFNTRLPRQRVDYGVFSSALGTDGLRSQNAMTKPEGTAEAAQAQASLRDSARWMTPHPALKRRAIAGCPSGTC